LGELRPGFREISFIGNEAFPPDHPVEQARVFCKATYVLYDASGPALIIKFGGPTNNPDERSRQVICMHEQLKGKGFQVEGFPGE